jgi:hypothetical protein
MNKNFIVVALPLTDADDYIDIPKCAFFSELDEAKEYMERTIFEETGNYYALPDKPSDIRIKLAESVLELWVCYIPEPVFLN